MFESASAQRAIDRSFTPHHGGPKSLEIENLAVTDGSTAIVPLYEGRNGTSAEWNILGIDVSGHVKAKHRFYVPAKSLDSYFHHGERVNLVKIPTSKGPKHSCFAECDVSYVNAGLC